MSHNFLKIVRVNRVQDCEEVITRGRLVPGKGIWKVLGEVWALLQLRPEPLDRELIVLRHLDDGHSFLLEELLLVGEDLLEKVLVDGVGRW